MTPSLARPNRLYNQALEWNESHVMSFLCFCCSRPVLFSHPKTNPPKGWRCSVLLRKQCHSSYLCNYGPVIPGMSRLNGAFKSFVFYIVVCGFSFSPPPQVSSYIAFLYSRSNISLYFFLGASWRGFFSLHCLQWWKCVWRIKPKGKITSHLLFLPFTRVYKPISAA